MGVFPLTFENGRSAATLGLDGTETYSFEGLKPGSGTATVRATKTDGMLASFPVNVRVDTPKEWEYMDNGGILHFVLRQLAA